MNHTIRLRIAEFRKRKGVTQDELANFLGISFQSVSKWERGESLPDIALLPALAAYFDVATDDILGLPPRSRADMKPLETPRLLLRGWRESDAEGYYSIYQSPDVTEAGARVCENVREGLKAVRLMIKNQESWAITLKDGGTAVGCVFLSDVNRHPRYKELEYVVAAAHRGRGYATEAAQAVLRHAFTELRLLAVAAPVYPGSDASRRVIEKCGFTYEGTLRRYGRDLRDSIRYSMTDEEWEKLYNA